MEFPLIDLSRTDNLEDNAAPVPGLKPLKWTSEELKCRLNLASLSLDECLERQREFKKQLHEAVDKIMSYRSVYSEYEVERQDIVERIAKVRRAETVRETVTEVEMIVLDLLRQVCADTDASSEFVKVAASLNKVPETISGSETSSNNNPITNDVCHGIGENDVVEASCEFCADVGQGDVSNYQFKTKDSSDETNEPLGS